SGSTNVGRSEARGLEVANRRGDRLGVAGVVGPEVGEGRARPTARQERAQGDDAERRERRARLGPRAHEYLTRDLPGTPQSDPGEEAGRPAQAGRAPEAVGEAMRGEDKGRCAGKAGGQGGKADLEPGGE